MFGWLVQVPASGNWRFDVDVSAYEAAANPDGSPISDSNPYGLLAEAGATIVTEAGGNALLRVAANGSISTLAVFPSRTNSTRGTDSVPTSVAVGPDGAYYVGELTGFVPGGANGWRVVPGQAPTVSQTGFTTIIDLTFGPGGEPLRARVRTRGSLACHAQRRALARGERFRRTWLGRDWRGRRPLRVQLQHLSRRGPYPCTGQVVRIPG